ncbi:MAG TPA: transcriptional regulator BetI [Xanthomonadales bacterium]|nr:transcriptional regulator BetI [Xanthomonadales bacterium]
MGKGVTSKASRRTAPPAQRRQQLILATIRSIASHGLSDTTMSSVAKEAGLSQGIINLHFQSKDRLLLETLRFVVDEYRTYWRSALSMEHDSAAEQLAALVGVDFEKALCDRDKLAVWFAFWGESKSRPTYRKLCAERDRDYESTIRALCQQITKEGDYTVDVDAVARGLTAMCQGFWLDLLVSPRKFSRDDAQRMCMIHLAAAFPDHFAPPDNPAPVAGKHD